MFTITGIMVENYTLHNLQKAVYVVLFLSLISISCGRSAGSKVDNQPYSLKNIDKQTLATMIWKLHQSIAVKNYSLENGLHALKPYNLKYKVCIPGFSKMVPYDDNYLYVYCVYDTKRIPPRVLSFRFQLPKQVAQQITTDDIRKPFKNWTLVKTYSDSESTTSNIYNAGVQNLSIEIMQQVLPNQKDSIITQVIVYH